MFMNMYVHGYVYVYDSICWALKCPVHCAEQFLELKICISPQFRAIDPPNPARGFIQQNENVRFATAACMQKYGNVSFATVACAKCMRYGGRGGGTHTMGGGGGGNTGHGTIYIYSPSGVCHIFEHLPLDPWAHLVLPPPPDSSVKTVGWGRTVLPTNPPHVYKFFFWGERFRHLQYKIACLSLKAFQLLVRKIILLKNLSPTHPQTSLKTLCMHLA